MEKTGHHTYSLRQHVSLRAIQTALRANLVLFIFFFSGLLVSAPTPEGEILNNFLSARQDKNQEKALELWLKHREKNTEINAQALAWAAEDNAVFLRRGVIRKFIEVELPPGAAIRDQLQNLIRSELLYIKNLQNNSEADLESLKICFEQVKKYKFSQIFYETAMYIAYPLIDIRQAAYAALEVIKDDRIIPLILRLAKSDSPIERTYALDALYYINDDRTIPLLITSLKDKNKSVRYYAIRTLEKMKATTAIPYFLRIIQEDLDNEVRIKAIQAVSVSKPNSGLSILNKNLADKDLSVRVEVLKALLKYTDASSAYYVSEQLAREKDDQFKLSLITSLLSFKGSGGMTGLNKVIKTDKNFDLRIWAIYVTGYYADNKGLDTLLATLKDSDLRIRAEAASAIGNYKNKKTAPALLAILKDANEKYEVQASALYSLELINYEGTLTSLFNLSENHPDAILRSQMKEVLRGMLAKRWPEI